MSVIVYDCLRTTVITGIRIIKKPHHKLDTQNLTDALIERMQRDFTFVDSMTQREDEILRGSKVGTDIQSALTTCAAISSSVGVIRCLVCRNSTASLSDTTYPLNPHC